MDDDLWSPEIGDDAGTVRACLDGGRWYFLSRTHDERGTTVLLRSRYPGDEQWMTNFALSSARPNLGDRLYGLVPRTWSRCRDLMAGEWDPSREEATVDAVILGKLR